MKLSFHDIEDTDYLSRLLELYIAHLETTGFENNLRALSWHSGIPEHILGLLASAYRLSLLHDLRPEDFHTVLDRLCDLYPAHTLWVDQESGEVYVRM